MFAAVLLLLSGVLLLLGTGAAAGGRQWVRTVGLIVGLADIMQAIVLMV